MHSQKLLSLGASVLAATMLWTAEPAIMEAAPLDSSLYAALFDNSNGIFQREMTYVVGHMSPDTDSVCTAIAYAHLKNELGVTCTPMTNGKINRETAFVLDYFGVPVPKSMENAADKQVILVDHATYAQAVPGMKEARIVEIIDHHNVDDIETSQPILYLDSKIGATSTLVYMIYRSCDVEITREMAGMMLGAILSDTRNLTKDSATPIDKAAVAELSQLAGVENVDAFYAGMAEALNNHEGMTVADIACSDYKEYSMGETLVGIGVVKCEDTAQFEEMSEAITQQISAIHARQNSAVQLFLISIVNTESKQLTLAFDGENAGDIMLEAFEPDEAGDHYLYFGKSKHSRKNFLVPSLRAVLE